VKIEKVIPAIRIAGVFFAVTTAAGCAGRQVELGNGSGPTAACVQ
jgi:hypothetical protein